MSRSVKLFEAHKNQQLIIDSLLDEDYFHTVCVIGRQWGKSSLGMNMCMYWASQRDTNIWWVSHTDEQANKVYKDMLRYFKGANLFKKTTGSKGSSMILFKNGSVIHFKSAKSGDSLRGESIHYMILDECAFFKQDTIEAVLWPMMAITGKKIVYLTTPKGKNHIYKYFNNGLDVKEPDWNSFRFSSSDSPYMTKKMYDMFKKAMNPKLFDQEYNAEFVDSASLFDNLSDTFILPEIELNPNDTYWVGVDIGLVSDQTIVAIMNADHQVIKYYKWKNITAPKLINELDTLFTKHKKQFFKIFIESNNQGLPIIQELQVRNHYNIEGFNTSSSSKTKIINNLIMDINTSKLKIVNDEGVKKEFEGFIFEQGNNGNIRFFADYGYYDDSVMATAICLECYNENKYTKADPSFYQIRRF